MKPSVITIVGFGLYATGLSVAHAAAWVPFSATAGAQCAPVDINNTGITAGNCRPASTTANNVPWIADGAAHGAQSALTSLTSGQPCSAYALSNNGKVMGNCKDASNSHFGVAWDATSPATTPIKLDPLPATLLIPLLRPKDVATKAVAINDQGDMAGSSLNADNQGTAVFYANGSGTPERVSDWGDNCAVADVNSPTTGTPQLALNCPNNAGNTTARVAEKNGLFYSMTDLALPTGASYCTVTRAINASSFVGTCIYPNSAVNVTKSAFWSNKTAVPVVLTLSSGSKNMAISINEAARVLVSQATIDGRNQYMVWVPSPLPLPLFRTIPLPSGSAWGEAGAISSGEIVGLNVLNSDQHSQGCTWTQSTETVCLLPIGGGKNSEIKAVSKNGAYMAGMILNATQTVIAVTATLP
ncbi:hypothetical protein C4K03_6065 [Pseudomonas synxantha]|uniref:Secreted protein n=1 Tax=Pseudomonas synxantha TaxID=47883 RepID=A0A3G7UHZ3_9PSED|nr:hypothetical protein [Pseudomonas synxantha]AZE58172.1 hypothetical protein C4K03_6065 [Pseudomonas synxantha]